MIRRIIEIDEERCSGCGLCADACHEGAIGMVDGKARLLRDDYCDGLGDCLPACPEDAIHFVEREAAPYDEAAVKAKQRKEGPSVPACGCPGTESKALERSQCTEAASPAAPTHLRQWPVQIKLAPVRAPYFENAHLLIAADCTAYAYGNFHSQFMKGRVTLIGCPKLDDVDYTEKLAEIIGQNEIESVTVARMEVPCCGGLEMAVTRALQKSGKALPLQVTTVSTDGRILE